MCSYLTILRLLRCMCVGTFLLWTVPAHAVQPYTPVQPDPVLEQWRWRTYDELAGLGLRCLAEDASATMWFGVSNGTVSYDGVDWVQHAEGIYGAPVITLLGTSDGTVYAGTRLGISRFKDGAWKRFYPIEGDLAWPVFGLKESASGGIWAATPWGALRIESSATILYTSSDVAEAMSVLQPDIAVEIIPDQNIPARQWSPGIGLLTLQGHDHNIVSDVPMVIWHINGNGPAAKAGLSVGDRLAKIGERGQLVTEGSPGSEVSIKAYRSQGDSVNFSLKYERLAGSYRDFRVNDIVDDPQTGSVWISLFQGEVLRFKPGSGQEWETHDSRSGLVVRTEPLLSISTDGRLWAASTGEGHGSFFDGQSWSEFETPTTVFMNSVLSREDGSTWTGGWGGALQIFRDGNWTLFRSTDLPLPEGRLVGITEAKDGSVWIAGLRSSVSRVDLDPERWLSFESLVYQTTSDRDGSIWFTSITEDPPQFGVVRLKNGIWTRFGSEDGLMTRIYAVHVSNSGRTWAVGSGPRPLESGAIAVLDGNRWKSRPFPSSRSVLRIRQSSDGELTFIAQNGGIARFREPESLEDTGIDDEARWTIVSAPEVPDYIVDLATAGDGTKWLASANLFTYRDGWVITDGPASKARYIEEIETTKAGSAWFGTRADGAFHFDHGNWTQHTTKNGLASNTVLRQPDAITESADGSIWISTGKGVSRFDGESWTTHALPSGLWKRPTGVRETTDGSLWVSFYGSSTSNQSPRTVRYRPPRTPPDTWITLSVPEVSHRGNISLRWAGVAPGTSVGQMPLQFSWKVDGGQWSPYGFEKVSVHSGVSVGNHTFSVKARDRDFNEDPTPAVVTFSVLSPVWQQGWFIGMVVVFVGGIGFQTSRVVRRDRRLRKGNEALSDANKELFQVNIDLQREQVLERLRGQAQGMQSSEDIAQMAEAVHAEMNSLGLNLVLTGIMIEIPDRDFLVWATKDDGSVGDPFVSGDFAGSWEAKGRGNLAYHHLVEGEEARAAIRKTFTVGGNPRWANVPEAQWPQRLHSDRVFFNGGRIYVGAEDPISEECLVLIKRFGETFGFAYRRSEELRQKEVQNKRLAVEASVQRLRAEVQSMDEASDFERILSLLTDSLKSVELTFDGCEIDVLDEPVENPTMEHFEANGFRYSTFRMDPDGNVASDSHNLAAPFPSVIEQTVERFIAGEPWHGMSEDERIVEVPAGSYGRLRLTAKDREQFTDDEVATLREFADAVALGYARYLDIREIQEATVKKSAFLASMSHELRTPMNAIKGFTNLVLRRDDSLAEKSRENLQKVTHASDHLLTMINDLLDLSKIEAGRMDVNATTFNVKELITSSCDTVSPLIQDGVELKQEASDGEANTDKARVQQMVINLLSNAIKFTDSGSVSVKAEVQGGREQRGDDLVISVTDTGKGIPAEEIPTLFDEYRQVEGQSESSVQKGTGLGLSITRKFAELLGGSIRVESEVGKGSTFTVRVPAEYSV